MPALRLLFPGAEEAHGPAHALHGPPCDRARPVRARPQEIGDHAWLRPEPAGALANRSERGYHIVRQHSLAVEAAPARGPAIVRHQLEGVRRREALVNREDVADVGVPRVLARDACGIGRRGLELLPDRLWRIEEADGVAEALGHLGLTIEPEDALGGRQQRLRLGK